MSDPLYMMPVLAAVHAPSALISKHVRARHPSSVQAIPYSSAAPLHLAVIQHRRANVSQERAPRAGGRQRQPRKARAGAQLEADAAAQALAVRQYVVRKQQRAAPDLQRFVPSQRAPAKKCLCCLARTSTEPSSFLPHHRKPSAASSAPCHRLLLATTYMQACRPAWYTCRPTSTKRVLRQWLMVKARSSGRRGTTRSPSASRVTAVFNAWLHVSALLQVSAGKRMHAVHRPCLLWLCSLQSFAEQVPAVTDAVEPGHPGALSGWARLHVHLTQNELIRLHA